MSCEHVVIMAAYYTVTAYWTDTYRDTPKSTVYRGPRWNACCRTALVNAALSQSLHSRAAVGHGVTSGAYIVIWNRSRSRIWSQLAIRLQDCPMAAEVPLRVGLLKRIVRPGMRPPAGKIIVGTRVNEIGFCVVCKVGKLRPCFDILLARYS